MNDPVLGAIGITLCLVLSAFFSGSETALTSIGRTRAQRMIDEEGVLSMRLWLDRPAHVLTAILICNNIVNVTASALATETAKALLPAADSALLNPVAVAIGVMTLLLLTFGEITPKTLARLHARRIAGPIMQILGPITKLLTIPNAIFVGLAGALAKLGGHDLHAQAPSVQEDDITYLATLGLAEGSIEEQHADLIQRVFSLDDTLVEVVMVPWEDVVALPIDAERATILQTLTRTRHSRLPVFQDRHNDVVGLLYAKDMLRIEEILPDAEPL
ncbi:MAG: putative hemolysin, partial [Bradymonadia bacterium]